MSFAVTACALVKPVFVVWLYYFNKNKKVLNIRWYVAKYGVVKLPMA